MRLILFKTLKIDQLPIKFKLGNANNLTQMIRENLNKRFTQFNNWYTKLIGLDEVKMYQDRVVALQDRLLSAQEKRRQIAHELAEIRKKSNQMQDELHKIKRQNDLERFLQLMREETQILLEEKEVLKVFHDSDQAERELFTAFTNAIRDSHEKQRAQLEYTKYFGLVLSIAGSLLAFFISSFKKNDLKSYIEQHLSADRNKTDILVDVIRQEMKRLQISPSDDIYRKLERLIMHPQTFSHQINVPNSPNNRRVEDNHIWFYVGVSIVALAIIKLINS